MSTDAPDGVSVLILLVTSLSVYSQDILMIDGQPCGINGSAKQGSKEFLQNNYKNRYTLPKEQDFDMTVTLDKLIASNSTADRFSQDKAVEITGYVYNIKYGSIETCNCKTNNPLFQDTHIELTPNEKDTGPEKRLIIEVTPVLSV